MNEWIKDILSLLKLLLVGLAFLAVFIGVVVFKSLLKSWMETYISGDVLAVLGLFMFVGFLTVWTVMKLRARRQRIVTSRMSTGLCPVCGYDLKGWQGRCPQCFANS